MADTRSEPIRILLISPYQPPRFRVCSPPLGLLYLVSTLRQHLGDRVEIRLIDAVLHEKRWTDLEADIREFSPHLVGLSSLNWHARETGRIALLIKERFPEILVALGGPLAHRNTTRLARTNVFDWIFDGEADFAFPIAVERWFFGARDLDDIVGLTWRDGKSFRTNGCPANGEPMAGMIGDLDEIPFPAWDLVDFDAYARVLNMNVMTRGRRYATLFTSRGCPFLCTYCHDIFGKKFRWRSPDNVEAEVRLLRERYGVDELQIVDDIFNMNSQRMRAVCARIEPYKMHLAFPNGLRFDILDDAGVKALTDAGTYSACVAIETVTPRLQDMVRKRLRIEPAQRAIKAMSDRGVLVAGFFMIGFPTETLEEVQATVDWALRSELVMANFFIVVPQPGTPLHEVALQQAPHAMENQIMQEYDGSRTWYNDAYGVDITRIQRRAHLRFYLANPKRCWRLIRGYKFRELVRNAICVLRVILKHGEPPEEELPEALLPLAQLYESEPEPVTSAAFNDHRPEIGSLKVISAGMPA